MPLSLSKRVLLIALSTFLTTTMPVFASASGAVSCLSFFAESPQPEALVARLYSRLLPRFKGDAEFEGLSSHLTENKDGPYIGPELKHIGGLTKNGPVLEMNVFFAGIKGLETGESNTSLNLGFAKYLTAILHSAKQRADRDANITTLEIRSDFTVNADLKLLMKKYGFRVDGTGILESYILEIPIGALH